LEHCHKPWNFETLEPGTLAGLILLFDFFAFLGARVAVRAHEELTAQGSFVTFSHG
jgi:hypothetical protein